MWTLYLTIAEGGFRSRRNSDFQLRLAKPLYRDPRNLGFITAGEDKTQQASV